MSVEPRTRTVRLEGPQLTIGRSNANDVVLDDVNVSRFHAVVEVAGTDLELRDLHSRCGTRLDGRPVKRALLRTGAEIGVGPFRLLFDGTAFEGLNERGSITLQARGLSVRAGDRTILRDAALTVAPGELVAVIGESGSGKSTLLKALAGVSRPDAGTVTLNGDPVTSRQTDTGYVPQEEIVHRLLTVREALTYAARLRLPGDTEGRVLDRTVARVMAEVGLEGRADVRIGQLSGGQRKRAGVGCELLNRPSLLFLDEPTTGLDPRLELQMMELFRALAEPGRRAVVLVTHATMSLDLCDKLAVLGAGGQLVFFGPPQAARSFFGVESFDAIYQVLDADSVDRWRLRYEAYSGGLPEGEHTAAPPGPAPGPAGSVRAQQRPLLQFAVLVGRYLHLFGRDTRNLTILFAQVPLIAMAIGLLFRAGVFDQPGYGHPTAVGSPRDGVQLLFILVTTAIWFGAIDGSREIVKERSVAGREAAVGVGWGAYLASKAVVLCAVATAQTVLLTVIVLAIQPLHGGAGQFLGVLVLLVLTAVASVGMGLAISASVSSEDQATSFIPLALIPQLLFAGAIVPLARMRSPLGAVADAVFARWSLAGAGHAIDVPGRYARLPRAAGVQEYGHSFFSLPVSRAAVVLVLFLAGFLGLSRLLLSTRVARRAA